MSARNFNCPLAVLQIVVIVIAFMSLCIRADKDLLCLVCNAVVEEIESEIRKAKPGQKLKVGNFRMDAIGNYQLKSEVEYARSETHLNDVLDGFCARMDNYAEATYKENGVRTILKLTTTDGGLHPDIGNVDFVQDGDLNKKLKFYCETIIEEFEDNILTIFSTKQEDAVTQLCAQATGFCPFPDDDDDDGNQGNVYKSASGKDEL